MTYKTIRQICLLLLPLLAFGQFHDGLTHHTVLGSNDKYHLYWKPGQSGTDDIEFEVQVKTKGWIGLGFSPNGAMAGSDIVIMWIDTNGQPHISDRHGPTEGTNGFPPEDAHQNYEIIAARENGTHTIIRFKRKQSTCDVEDWQITSDTTRIIWAFNDVKPKSSEDIQGHSKDTRGVRSTNLLYPQTNNKAQEVYHQPGIKTVDVFAKNVKVPNDQRTLYWCQIFQVPKFSQKHHLIGYEMLVQPGHEKYVHHLVIYGCRSNMSQYLNKPQACFDSESGFSAMKECSDVLTAWAIGGEAFVYPDGMASIWYGDEYDYVVGEFHYDNSEFTKDIVDSSGMRMYLTDKLRPIETGRLTMGSPTDARQLIVPPKTESFTMYAYCPAQCTMNLQDEPMTIFSGILHTHLLGVKLRLRQIRNGVDLGDILADSHYDFNYQSPIVLDKYPKILPGDDLILECEYNSKNRDVPTFGGLGTPEEMCLAFIEYFPKRERLSEGCYSGVSAESLMTKLGAKKVALTDAAEKTTVINERGQNQTFTDMVKGLDWGANDAKRRFGLVEDFQSFIKDEPHGVACLIFPRNKNDPKASNVSIQLKKNPTFADSLDHKDPACNAASYSATLTAIIFLASAVLHVLHFLDH